MTIIVLQVNSTITMDTIANHLTLNGTNNTIATSATAAQRMGMSFGIHSLLGLATACDMHQGTTTATYLTTSTPQYCTNQTAPTFFPHNTSQLFTMEMVQNPFDRMQPYESINQQGNSFLCLLYYP